MTAADTTLPESGLTRCIILWDRIGVTAAESQSRSRHDKLEKITGTSFLIEENVKVIFSKNELNALYDIISSFHDLFQAKKKNIHAFFPRGKSSWSIWQKPG